MKAFFYLSAAIVFFGTASLHAAPKNPPPEPSASSVYRFAGFSTQTVTGGTGIANMYRVCQEDIDNPQAKMCNTEEFIQSPGISAITPNELDQAWINPLYVNDSRDYSGYAFTHCAQWASELTTSVGLTAHMVSGVLLLENSYCDVTLPITCCAPQ